MSITEDIKYMEMALQMSLEGSGFVNPNPLVGAVIVKDGKVIGKGCHEQFGGPHAEIGAIQNTNGIIEGATIYVTLEPCNHQGKTPPCTDALIREKFDRVVVGMKDPNVLVNGKGIKQLRKAGIKVDTGVLENEIVATNEAYIKFITSQNPFCSLKTAMTLDGKISTYSGESKWISNEKSRNCVHKLRHRYAAIMVGVNTIIKDNPILTDRSEFKKKSNPLRIIADSKGRTPLNSFILNTSEAKTIIAVTKNANGNFINSVEKRGAEVIICPENNKKIDLKFLIEELGKRGIDSILLEGGSTLNFSAIQAGIVDKVYSFISPKMLGGETAKTPIGGVGFKNVHDAITLNIDNIQRFDDDLMITSYIIKN
ncbi:MAG: bifunctional diaminohydroxyphosphoribosylaminopyrimidine deaminase/5-amino-6-(5-phosphoribosylamino)uracil reductase RibD [Bacteroidales bacterium]|nr:bifunctional diaminohydroxyphosphoribosylaminopyrimidine deaminase/5-amino-6-(5-phosphoribosylamino)uracil reductase RibD [Bacteroidales bacterium]